MGEDTRDPVIELATRGVGLLRSRASPRTLLRAQRCADVRRAPWGGGPRGRRAARCGGGDEACNRYGLHGAGGGERGRLPLQGGPGAPRRRAPARQLRPARATTFPAHAVSA